MISRREALARPFTVGALAVLWCLIWGQFTLGNLVNGVLLGVVLLLVFPQPALDRELTLRPWGFVVLAATFVYDLATSAVEVAFFIFSKGPRVRSSIVAVELRSRSDLFLTLTAVFTTLVPGSLIVEAQRSTGTLFVHVIGAVSDDDRAEAKRTVLRQEARLLRALGSRRTLEEAGLR